MIAIAVAWPQLIAAIEAASGEVAGWISAAPPHVHLAALTADGGWSDRALLELVAAARSSAPPLALFHSHPDGRAALSTHDRAAWAPRGTPLWPWPQLVVATRVEGAIAAALFAWPASAARPHAIAELRRGDSGWRVVS